MAGALAHGAGRAIPRARRQTLVLTGLLALGIAAWCVVVALLSEPALATRPALPRAVLTLSSGLLLVVGASCGVQWRLTGSLGSARRALAFVVLGVAVPVSSLIGPQFHEMSIPASGPPSARLPFLVLVFLLLAPARDGSGAASRRQAHALLVALAAGGGAVVLGRLLLTPAGGREASCVLAVAAGLAWTALAARDRRLASGRWVATGYLLLAVAEVLRGLVAAGLSGPIGYAPGVQLAAALVLLGVAQGEVRATYRLRTEEAAQLSAAVAALHREVSDIECAQRQRLHDARTAMVGMLGASALLADARADVDHDRLCRLIVEELQRLNTVLDSAAPEATCRFDIAGALAPVVRMHQLDGARLRAQLDTVTVLGRPRTTATVLDNLLRNAQVHARGARIDVRTELDGATVRIVVEDDGPGIPASERDRVLGYQVRGTGTRTSGEGIGLYAARAAMIRQGGSLRLEAGASGGTRVVLSLPVAEVPSLLPVAG